MTQKTFKIFVHEIFSKGRKHYYIISKTDVSYIDDIWSCDILDLKDYGAENIRGYRYVLEVFDSFSKFGRTLLLKKNAQTKKVSLENTLICSKRKPNLIETDHGKEFYNTIFQNVLNNNNIKHYSRNTSLGTVFAERFYRTIRDLPRRPVFEKGESNWIDSLPSVTKQNINRKHSATKLTPIQASL